MPLHPQQPLATLQYAEKASSPQSHQDTLNLGSREYSLIPHTTTTPTPDLINGEANWEIEIILSSHRKVQTQGKRKRKQKFKLFYTVRWVGGAITEEPQENLLGTAKEMIEEFNQRQSEIREIETSADQKGKGFAVQKVFETYELLEKILILVKSNSTVLQAQQINKTFRHVINRSLGLQRKLFFKTATLDEYHQVQAPSTLEQETGYAINPLFLDRDGHPRKLACTDWTEREPRKILGEHPVAISLHVEDTQSYSAHRSRSLTACLCTPAFYSKYRSSQVQESWRRMLVVHYRNPKCYKEPLLSGWPLRRRGKERWVPLKETSDDVVFIKGDMTMGNLWLGKPKWNRGAVLAGASMTMGMRVEGDNHWHEDDEDERESEKEEDAELGGENESESESDDEGIRQ